MVNTQLLEYIKMSVSRGHSINELRTHLINKEGLLPEEVDEAITLLSNITYKNKSGVSNKKKFLGKRNIWLVILLSLLTFGIYAIFLLISFFIKK